MENAGPQIILRSPRRQQSKGTRADMAFLRSVAPPDAGPLVNGDRVYLRVPQMSDYSVVGGTSGAKQGVPDAVGAGMDQQRTHACLVPAPSQILCPGPERGSGLRLLPISRRIRCTAWRTDAVKRSPRGDAGMHARILDWSAIRGSGLHDLRGAGSCSVRVRFAAPPSSGGVMPAQQRGFDPSVGTDWISRARGWRAAT